MLEGTVARPDDPGHVERGHPRAVRQPRRAVAVKAAIMVCLFVVAGGCGSQRPSGEVGASTSARLVKGTTPVRTTPTSSPGVRCIRDLTAAMRAIPADGGSASTGEPGARSHELAALRSHYGADSAQVHAYLDNVGAFLRDTRRYGPDVAAGRVWPALAAACA